jgi:hypothetical protein
LKTLLCDLEGNGLLPDLTRIHCLCAVDVDSGEEFQFGPEQIAEALELLKTYDRVVFHNGIGYDYPGLKKLHGFVLPDKAAWDSLVIARLKYPNVKELDSRFNKKRITETKENAMGDAFGSHSIEAWGIRLGVPKLHADIEDWSKWTPEMQERCMGDVRTLLRIWEYLKPDLYSEPAIELEHRTARLCYRITEAGWPFDITKAQDLDVLLAGKSEAIEKQLIAEFKGWEKRETFVPKKNNAKRGYVAGVPFIKKKWIEFNPKSRDHIIRALQERGWKPVEFTDKGKPRLDDEIIEGIASQFPGTEDLAEYLMLNKRRGQVSTGDKAWLKYVKDDGRIHGEYNPMGAVTSRASHYNPNIAQVPKVSSPYGEQCRELFIVPEGWEMVGADMSGLEGRCFSHYLAKHDGGKYGEALLSGDPHWAVVNAVGYLDCDRDKKNPYHTLIREEGAKRLFYGMLYGSGDEKAGRIVLAACRMARKAFPEDAAGLYFHYFGNDDAPNAKLLKAVGKRAKFDVISGIEGFSRLKQTIDIKADTGFLPGLDGRRLPVRSAHAALNTLLQSAGAILCKRWICDSYDALINDGLRWGWDGDFVFLGWIHDEVQVACRNGLGDRIGRVLTDTAQEAGVDYSFRIALDSQYKIGKTWADTH